MINVYGPVQDEKNLIQELSYGVLGHQEATIIGRRLQYGEVC